MKVFLVILSLIVLSSCGPKMSKEYHEDVVLEFAARLENEYKVLSAQKISDDGKRIITPFHGKKKSKAYKKPQWQIDQERENEANRTHKSHEYMGN